MVQQTIASPRGRASDRDSHYLSWPVPARPAAAVEVRNLVKRYPRRSGNAVDGISFAIPRGAIFGLLGPAGAGKSTTIGILTTRVLATSGQARVSGIDVLGNPVAARSKFAVVPQRVNVDRAASARQNLLFHAAYHGVPRGARERRADQLLEQFELTGRAHDRVDSFSADESQRLMLVRALMHQPDVLFLDKLSAELEPSERPLLWDRIRQLRRAGLTVVMSTADVDEAEQLCDRIAIMDEGRLLAVDTPTGLTGALPGGSTLDLRVAGAAGLAQRLSRLPGVARTEARPLPAGAAGSRLRLYLDGEPAQLLALVAGEVAAAGAQLYDACFGRATLDEVFISLTGRALR
ncbi:MAG: ABC transporter ATP-binding protein [Jatrophihabitantaceae bacterium]